MAALDTLARRDRPAEDLRRKLREKGYDATVVKDVVERLVAEKLVDDRRYVTNFIVYHAGRGHGPRRVRADLRVKGVPDELVEDAIHDFGEWLSQAERTRRKKFGAVAPADYADKQRQARFLAHRGFTGPQIRTTLGFDLDLDADTTL